MTEAEFNEMAWRDFVMFAWSQDDAHAAFRGATGRPQRTKRGCAPINFMIDRAVGGSEDDAYMHEFVDWVTRTQWGEEMAPEGWQALQVPAHRDVGVPNTGE